MPERYTAKDVQETFKAFAEVAHRAGFDTEHWVLTEGDSYKSWQHYTRTSTPDGSIGSGLSGTEFRSHLGSTTREAYQTLSTRIDTLTAVAELQRKTDESR